MLDPSKSKWPLPLHNLVNESPVSDEVNPSPLTAIAYLLNYFLFGVELQKSIMYGC